MKLITTYILISFLMIVSAYGQSKDNSNDDYVIEQSDYVLSFDSLKTKDKLHYGFTMGAGFGLGSYGNYFSSYYQPTISYDVTPKFKLKTGITYVNSSVNNFPVLSDFSYQPFSGTISQYSAFVAGQYQLTDRLAIGGSIFYDFTSYNAFDGSALNTDSNFNKLGYSAYFEYKVAKGFSIQGEIRINDRNPYGYRSGLFSNGLMGAESSLFGR